MSGFYTKERNDNGEYEITFYTENRQDFEKVQDLCRELIGHGKPVSNEGDLISRSELKKAIENYLAKRQDVIIWETDMFNMLDNAPTVEFSKEICSACGRYIREKGGAE